MEVRKPIPVILDVDPGVDDALAIILALQCKDLDVRGITACFGNRQLWRTLRNALQLVELMGRDIPVAKGASEPLCKPLREYDGPDDHLIHGLEGLGPVVLPAPTHHEVELPAPDFIAELLRQSDEPITLIPVGPLTNIATALLLYPELKKSIAHLTIMGGSAKYGNSSPYGEFNIWVDPYAAKLVMESGIPITLLGLDTTHQCELEPEDLARMVGIESALHPVVDQLADFMVAQAKGWGGKPVIHDALAVASLMDEQVVRFKDCHVSVETRSPYTFGQTVIGTPEQAGKPANARVAYWADKERFIEDMKKAIGAYSKGGAHLCSQSI